MFPLTLILFFLFVCFVSWEPDVKFVHLTYWSLLGHKSIQHHSSSYCVSFALWPAMLILWSIPAAKLLLLPFGWFNSLPSLNVHPGIRKCRCVSTASGQRGLSVKKNKWRTLYLCLAIYHLISNYNYWSMDVITFHCKWNWWTIHPSIHPSIFCRLSGRVTGAAAKAHSII